MTDNKIFRASQLTERVSLNLEDRIAMSESELNFTKSLFAESEGERKRLEQQLAERDATIAALREFQNSPLCRQRGHCSALEYDNEIKRRDATIAQMTRTMQSILTVPTEPDPRDATIARLQQDLGECLAGMDADALIIGQAGRDIAERDAKIARLLTALREAAQWKDETLVGVACWISGGSVPEPMPRAAALRDALTALSEHSSPPSWHGGDWNRESSTPEGES